MHETPHAWQNVNMLMPIDKGGELAHPLGKSLDLPHKFGLDLG
jgi:hypothetical protein